MEQDKHIVKSYDEEIKDINSKILEMGTLVENQLKDSLNALKNQDTELAEKVILNDDLIDDAYNKLDQSLVEILGKRQPMATDLRTIFSAIKMNKDLERLGDHATNIAKRAFGSSK
jgi:phosphate transport system protein